jgi:hypothetical protein
MNEMLVSELEARAGELSARVIEDMYRDPFWLARFGERGRKFAHEDGRRHLSYLAQALVANDATVLVEYARWLRPVLTSRGMCSLHLDENLERIGRALEADVSNAGPALAFLERARDGLRYASGTEGELEAVKARLVETAAAEAATAGHTRASTARELAHVFSYLRDAAALGRTDLFVEYVAFAEQLGRGRGRAPGDLGRALLALDRQLERAAELSEGARNFAREAVARARSRLEAAPAHGTASGSAVSGGQP